jgi:citrate lyase alpha subunit
MMELQQTMRMSSSGWVQHIQEGELNIEVQFHDVLGCDLNSDGCIPVGTLEGAHLFSLS